MQVIYKLVILKKKLSVASSMQNKRVIHLRQVNSSEALEITMKWKFGTSVFFQTTPSGNKDQQLS